MLETVNLTKIYRPKKGVPVKALDRVSLRFPDAGMVFLLGKSGSGKSTLLNVLGGLDRYDDGEILIKGVSSRSFSQKHFDSYRNTYVGFIFQEYNVLEEFTVGVNVALALQLQGKKADDDAINRILHEVDLDGYGNRKPNELSGGQKQRVAIARALVKQPQIIMADEPTGALDSATGKQVFDTLKKLSAEKLVIVVSHDREFAEQYADRIIELSDGKVISDVSRDNNYVPEPETISFDGDTITVPPAYHLTEEDRKIINEYLDQLQTGASIRTKRKTLFQFRNTDPKEVVQAGGEFHLIKSRLPMKYAFRMGAGGLKHKKIRLVFTILLSCVAFVLFALSDTFGAFDNVTASTQSILDTGVPYATLEKGVILRNYVSGGHRFTEAERKAITEETNVAFTGAWTPQFSTLSYADQLAHPDAEEGQQDGETKTIATIDAFTGYAEAAPEWIEKMGYQVTGALPKTDQEIAVSKFVYETFAFFGFVDARTQQTVKISSMQDLIGKTLTLGGRDYTVTGIVDTGFDRERYEKYANMDRETASPAERILAYAMIMELENAVSYSPVGFAMVAPGTLELLSSEEAPFREISYGSLYFEQVDEENYNYLAPRAAASLADCEGIAIHWLDGQPRTQLSEKEVVVSLNMLNRWSEEPLSEEELLAFSQNTFQLSRYVYGAEEQSDAVDGYRVVGYVDPREVDSIALQNGDVIIAHPSVFEGLCAPADEEYSLLIGAMPQKENDVRNLVSYALADHDGLRYSLANPVTFELNTVDDVIKVLAKVFLYIGIGFAVFAALLLSNFIAVSISYKKQEIGILRAIGSRGNDVFRIFFSESFLIAMINFVLSSGLSAIIVARINGALRSGTGLLLTILHFGFRQILLLLVISLAIAAAASFLPVRKIAAKRPIDAIRNR